MIVRAGECVAGNSETTGLEYCGICSDWDGLLWLDIPGIRCTTFE